MENATPQVKVNETIIDISMADINQLHELEKQIGKAKSFQIKYAAHKLLMKELGDQYEEFIKTHQITIQGSDGKTYILHINGHIEIVKDGEIQKTGQLYRSGYPAEDALVTFIKYVKFNADKLENLWGCGNIKLQGGELASD